MNEWGEKVVYAYLVCNSTKTHTRWALLFLAVTNAYTTHSTLHTQHIPPHTTQPILHSKHHPPNNTRTPLSLSPILLTFLTAPVRSPTLSRQDSIIAITILNPHSPALTHNAKGNPADAAMRGSAMKLTALPTREKLSVIAKAVACQRF